jgi:hypothetical protein
MSLEKRLARLESALKIEQPGPEWNHPGQTVLDRFLELCDSGNPDGLHLCPITGDFVTFEALRQRSPEWAEVAEQNRRQFEDWRPPGQ